MVVRARVSVFDDPPGHPKSFRNEVVWVHEGVPVGHIGYRMQPREGFVKYADVGALVEARCLRHARPARTNIEHVIMVDRWVEQIV